MLNNVSFRLAKNTRSIYLYLYILIFRIGQEIRLWNLIRLERENVKCSAGGTEISFSSDETDCVFESCDE